MTSRPPLPSNNSQTRSRVTAPERSRPANRPPIRHAPQNAAHARQNSKVRKTGARKPAYLAHLPAIRPSGVFISNDNPPLRTFEHLPIPRRMTAERLPHTRLLAAAQYGARLDADIMAQASPSGADVGAWLCVCRTRDEKESK